MKLSYLNRSSGKKSTSKNLRRTGSIPAVIYSRGQDSKHVAISTAEFSALLRNLQPGRLATTVIELQDEDGKSFQAVLKEIQYHPTTYDVNHLDFESLVEENHVKIKVPIECTGVADCVGVKLGGVLRQVKRFLRVSCLPKDIPACFQLDVRTLGNRESRRLKELTIPEGITPLEDLNEVAVVIAKR